MSQGKTILPHQSKKMFLTDGGLETTLVFIEGINLPHFAACILLETEEGTKQLQAYYRSYASFAKEQGVGFILESATWRANPGWAKALGYSTEKLEDINKKSIQLCQAIKNDYQTDQSPMPISGCIGPRGDGYIPGDKMTVEEAKTFHSQQISTFAKAGTDFITAMTISYINEAIGIALAAKDKQIPAVISFTVETDGQLPSGESLQLAIESIDEATDNSPIYYMVNCAHPSHFNSQFNRDCAWKERIRGIRANASCKSHAELDEATELDTGNPVELGKQYRDLLGQLPAANVLGGCCGTTHTHINQIYQSCHSHFPN